MYVLQGGAGTCTGPHRVDVATVVSGQQSPTVPWFATWGEGRLEPHTHMMMSHIQRLHATREPPGMTIKRQ
eukprot:100344-Chlamydomonas_euryale.AAC.5